MIKKSITFTNFNGEEVTKDYYFNLNESECMKLELGTVGGFRNKLMNLLGKNSENINDGENPDVNANVVPEIVDLFEMIILASYGQRSADADGFIKSEELRNTFKCSAAYNVLFMELLTNPDSAAKFFEGILPKAKVAPAIPAQH